VSGHFIDVILPIPIQKTFTYSVTQYEYEFLKKGMRVAVSFGKTKMYTGLVFKLHQIPPETYDAKEILQILDNKPIVTEHQLKHWEWISTYYMCGLGDVYRAALPSAFLLESETIIFKNESFDNKDILNDEEFLIYEALQHQSQLTIHQVVDILGKKKVLPIINELIQKSAVYIKEEIYEQYKPKLIKYVRLSNNYNSENSLELLMNELSRATKQREVIMTFFQLSASKKPIKVKDLEKVSGASSSIIKALEVKGVLEFYFIKTDRISYNGETSALKKLNNYQKQALKEIKTLFYYKRCNFITWYY